MRIYTAHVHRPILNPDRDVVLIKEGFNWPAFFFSFLWAIWCRLWLVAIGLAMIEVVLNGVLAMIEGDPLTRMAISLGVAAIVGMLANDTRRWTLFRRGYLEIAIVTGDDLDNAERRFWDQRPHLAADLVR